MGRPVKYLTKEEAAAEFGVSAKTLNKRLQEAATNVGINVETLTEGRTTTYRMTDVRTAVKLLKRFSKPSVRTSPKAKDYSEPNIGDMNSDSTSTW